MLCLGFTGFVFQQGWGRACRLVSWGSHCRRCSSVPYLHVACERHVRETRSWKESWLRGTWSHLTSRRG